MKEGLNPYLENFQVSSTLQDRPLADRASISETVKNARDGQISWALDPLRTFRESIINKKFPFRIIRLTFFLLCEQICFFMNVAG